MITRRALMGSATALALVIGLNAPAFQGCDARGGLSVDLFRDPASIDEVVGGHHSTN